MQSQRAGPQTIASEGPLPHQPLDEPAADLERLAVEIPAADGAGEIDVEEDEGNLPQGDDQVFAPRPLVREEGDSARRDVLAKPQLKVFLQGERDAVEFGHQLPANEVSPGGPAAVLRLARGETLARRAALVLLEQLLGERRAVLRRGSDSGAHAGGSKFETSTGSWDI